MCRCHHFRLPLYLTDSVDRYSFPSRLLNCTCCAGLMQAEGTAWAKPVVVPSAKGDADMNGAPLVPAAQNGHSYSMVTLHPATPFFINHHRQYFAILLHHGGS